MENKLEKQLEPKLENREKERPEISYHFYFSPHITAEDLGKNWKNAFDEADIYFPELRPWAEEDLRNFNDLSLGKITPEKLSEIYSEEENTARFKDWETIYNSKKPILFADIKEDSGLNIDASIARIWRERALDFFAAGDFKESLNGYKYFLREYAKFNLKREKKIKGNLDKQLKKFLKENPDYNKKEKLKVLVRLGIGHTTLYRDLKKEGKNISREFSQLPFVYDYSEEALRTTIPKNKLPDEMVARGISGELLYDNLKNLTQDSAKLYKIIRQIFSRLTIKDIEQISQNLGQSSSPDFNTFINEIEKFGIKLPKSEKEIDEIFSDSVKLSLAQ